jgi:F-type H+-transporting ATPase subunit delta
LAGARTSTARRYAEAIFQIAERDENVEKWLEQLDTVAIAAADEELDRLLENPHVPVEERISAIETPLGADKVPQMASLLNLLLRRRRIELLPRIAQEFRRQYNVREGIVEATATSAAELDTNELAALRTRLEQMTGGKVELTTSVDPSLLGGVQVRLGDTLIDGSVRGRLERLRNRLAAGTLTP